jgi:hypothetical protein
MDLDSTISLSDELVRQLTQPSPSTTDALQNARALQQQLQTLKRQFLDLKARNTAERDIFSMEMHHELVDREANAARTADRQRYIFERSSALAGQLSAFDKASQSTAFVESAVANLCPYATNNPSTGCHSLA